MDELHRVPCQAILQFCVVGVIRIGLHRVAEGVHARRGGHEGRQPHGQLRVQNGVLGNEGRVIDGRLVVGGRIGDHRRHRGLRACPGGGGDGKKQRDAVMDLQDTLELRHRFVRMHAFGRDALGAVHGRAAAEGHQALAALLPVYPEARLDVVAGGVALDVVEQRVFKAGLLQGREHLVQQPQLHQVPVRHHQGFSRALLLHELRQPGDAARALDILGHPVAEEIVSQLHAPLKRSAPDTVQQMCSPLFLLICKNRRFAGLDHHDGADGARPPAQAAAEAALRVGERRDSADVAPLLRLCQSQAAPGAVLDAYAAAGADGGVDRGLLPLRFRHPLYGFSPVVQDGPPGAEPAAGSAAHAGVFVDPMGFLRFACDGMDRAVPRAERAADAGRCIDPIGSHILSSADRAHKEHLIAVRKPGALFPLLPIDHDHAPVDVPGGDLGGRLCPLRLRQQDGIQLRDGGGLRVQLLQSGVQPQQAEQFDMYH